MDTWFDGLWWSRLFVHRGLAGIYFIAFLVARNQFPALLGERGLLPVPRYLSIATFREAPSLFHFRYSDRLLRGVAWLGMGLALFAATGFSEAGPWWLSLATWLALFTLYLSIVNVGQKFYAFGWESMLLEAGFFAAFLGPEGHAPSVIPTLILRFMLFRVELGAGLIKLRGDACWRDLTSLYYHHETQPLPNALSATFHRLPKPLLRTGVLFSHFVQLVVPFGLFCPQPIAIAAGGLIVVHQVWLIVSGNYAWLNWLTVVLGLSTLSDGFIAHVFGASIPTTIARGTAEDITLYAVAGVTLLLGVQPVLNLVSKHQRMNYSFNPLHLVNAYGAFGSITKKRFEVVLEGTSDEVIRDGTEWREYELKGKPGDPKRRPPQIAPYHLRLDWAFWFLPFSVIVRDGHIHARRTEPWFLRLMQRLLEGDPSIEKLFRVVPFEGAPPRWLVARFYRYEFATAVERRRTGNGWRRTLIGDYIPPLERADFRADAVAAN